MTDEDFGIYSSYMVRLSLKKDFSLVAGYLCNDLLLTNLFRLLCEKCGIPRSLRRAAALPQAATKIGNLFSPTNEGRSSGQGEVLGRNFHHICNFSRWIRCRILFLQKTNGWKVLRCFGHAPGVLCHFRKIAFSHRKWRISLIFKALCLSDTAVFRQIKLNSCITQEEFCFKLLNLWKNSQFRSSYKALFCRKALNAIYLIKKLRFPMSIML